MRVTGAASNAGNDAAFTAEATQAPVEVPLCLPVGLALVTVPLGATVNRTVTVPTTPSLSWQDSALDLILPIARDTSRRSSPFLLGRAVTCETSLREDRLHVARKIHVGAK